MKDNSPWPSFSLEEREKVSSVLESNKVNYWTGVEGREFEKEFATFTDSNFAIAVANGTVALDLALVALRIGRNNSGCLDDEVIVTSRTFLASVSSIITAGATPVFADVDLDSQNITVDSIQAVLTNKTKAIIVVHLAGMPAELDEIISFAKINNLFVIEDCAQAHGAEFRGKSVGSFGDIGVWSFCQDKIMTTGGEGGMVTTNSNSLWEIMWSYKDHGKSYDAVYNQSHPSGFRWLHNSFGTNWRLTEMQSAIGRIQLEKMKDWSEIRNRNARIISNTLSKYEFIRLVEVPNHIKHAYYKFYAFIKPNLLNGSLSRDEIVEKISGLGVPCFQGSCSEVYLEKAFDNTAFRPRKKLKNASILGQTSIMFLVHPTISITEIYLNCEIVASVLDEINISRNIS